MRDIEVVALLRLLACLLACLLTLGRSGRWRFSSSTESETLEVFVRPPELRLFGFWDVLRGWDLSEVHCRIPGQAHLSSDERRGHVHGAADM